MKKVVSLLLCWMIILSAVMMSFSAHAEAIEEPGAPDEAVISTDNFSKQDSGLAASGVSLDDPLIAPRINVTTENGNGLSLRKDDGYVNANISITDTDGSVLSDACSIKVRGNTTAFDSLPKKAYAFKFEKKKDVLGMGKAKKWVLLANIYDPSLLRNFTAFDMAHELGLDYTSDQKFVELWLDGSYRGCYTLYEQTQQGKTRVDIDIESNGGKKDFLVEFEDQEADEDSIYLHIDGMYFAIKDPDESTDEQVEYINDTMTGIINVLKTGDKEQIAAVIDIPSFAKFYLVNEYMKTMDFGNTSVYYYYKDGKLYGGPVWDFDKSSGSTDPTIGSVRAVNTYKTDGIMQSQQQLFKYFGKKDWFADEVKQVYEDHYDYFKNLSAEGGLLDTWREEYRELFDRNFTVWNIGVKWSNYQISPKATYQENYDYLKNWCSDRNSWLFDYYDLFSYEYLRGDADGSGAVNVLDATAVQRALTGMVPESDDGHMGIRAAVTTGTLNITDATVIQRYVAMMGNPYGLDATAKTKLREK